MSSKLKVMFVLFVACMSVFIIANGAIAAKPIAKITASKGEVFVLSGTEFKEITQGILLNDGDKIQTKNGEAEITFDDGAVMKIYPFTASMIQEKEEEAGWLFKTKTTARRLTALVGKLWFKSGSSNKKNILQTPSAVCGLRGSENAWGYDNMNSYLHQISGEVDTMGNWLRGVFETPGPKAALANNLYTAMVNAFDEFNAAEEELKTAKDEDKGKLEEKKIKALEKALKEYKKTLQFIQKNNPDPAVVSQASTSEAEADKAINYISDQMKDLKKEQPAEYRRQIRSFPTIPMTQQPTTVKPVSPIRR